MASKISPLTASTAFKTPLPPYLDLSPSRNSTASWAPVEAPEGTAARPMAPLSRVTSTSTVGLPRLSRICLAWMSMIALIPPLPQLNGIGAGSYSGADPGRLPRIGSFFGRSFFGVGLAAGLRDGLVQRSQRILDRLGQHALLFLVEPLDQGPDAGHAP